MPMNLKEGDRYVVNHGEGLTAVDFSDHVSLAEKEGAGMTVRRFGTGHAQQKEWSISYQEEEGAAVRQSTRRGCDNSMRALLGREGTVGRRSNPITIKQRGGARRWQRCNGGLTAGEARPSRSCSQD
ncbi:hypothetical protein GW17_00043697 [Ensete ventricosum]|nr:hypothetical protein GW17_00043697 [Ensete ventricosum]